MAQIGDAPLSYYVFIERESDLGTTRFLLVESAEADVYCPDTRDYRVEFQNTVWVDFLEVAHVQDIRQAVIFRAWADSFGGRSCRRVDVLRRR